MKLIQIAFLFRFPCFFLFSAWPVPNWYQSRSLAMAPETRSSDVPETHRFDALSAIDASLPLPLLWFVVVLPVLSPLVLCAPFFACAQRSNVAIAEIRALASFRLNLQDPLGTLDGWDCPWTDLPPKDCKDYIIVGGRTADCSFAITGLQASFTPSTVPLTPSPATQHLQGHTFVSQSKPSNYLSLASNVMTQDGFMTTLNKDNGYECPAQSFPSDDGSHNTSGQILGRSNAINGGFYSRADANFLASSSISWNLKRVNQSCQWVETAIGFQPQLDSPQDLQDHSFVSHTTRLALIFTHLGFKELATAAPSQERPTTEVQFLPSMGSILDPGELTELAQPSFDEFQRQTSLMTSRTLLWKELSYHFSFLEHDLLKKSQATMSKTQILSNHIWFEDFTYAEQPSTCCAYLTSPGPSHNSGTTASPRAPLRRCSICGVAAHFYCSQFAAKDCKCVAQAALFHVRHHCLCFYCYEIRGVPFVNASLSWHCRWCQRFIHVKCNDKLARDFGDVCDLGLFEAITGYGSGGSSMALFRQVGGGIYTKAVDVGAVLGGKVERKIPADDPRNPAVIADNVGDIAGMCSDMFGPHAKSSCAALVISSISSFGVNDDFMTMSYPLLISSMGILVCLIITLFATDFLEFKAVNEIEPALKRQLIISTVPMTIGIATVSWFALPSSITIFNFGTQNVFTSWQLFLCVGVSLWAGLIMGFVTEYYTSNAYNRVQDVADFAGLELQLVIFGLALGFKYVVIPIFAIAVSMFFFNLTFSVMYGIAVAAKLILSPSP